MAPMCGAAVLPDPMVHGGGLRGFCPRLGGTKAHTNRPMRANRVRKFREPPMFLGHDERTGPSGHQHRPSWLVLEIGMQLWRRAPMRRRRRLRRVALGRIRKEVGYPGKIPLMNGGP